MSDDPLDPFADELMSGQAIPPEMVLAVRAIASLEPDAVDKVSHYLLSIRGLASEEDIISGIRGLLPNADQDLIDNIWMTITNLRFSELPKTIGHLDRWRERSDDRRAFFPDDLFRNMNSNLPVLIKEYPSVAIFRKARTLLRAVGNELEEIAYFCDIRPVFDKSRARIEGFATIANLRIMYRTQNNDVHSFELALTESELRDMQSASTTALAKIEVMKAAIATFNQDIGK